MNSPTPMPRSLAEGRELLDITVSPHQRKQLGQCFTGMQTGRVLAALAVRRGQRRVVDPMAGHGDLIEAAAERARRMRMAPGELVGVEIEPEVARLGEWRLERCAQEYGFRRGRFIRGDAFDEATWDQSELFDLVIANPPYVRYQVLSRRWQEGGARLLNAEATRQALHRLAAKLAPPAELPIWEALIRSYSGLADLSLPSWLLCGLLTAASGILALVVPQTWMNRDYARLARYFFLRFFQPLAIVQESGQRWFRDALVPVSLVVGRRLAADACLTPLRERRPAFGATAFVEIDASAASERSHVGNAFAGDDAEGEFAEWLADRGAARAGVRPLHLSWESQRDEVLAGCQTAEWLRQLEGETATSVTTVPRVTALLPPSIAPLLPTGLLDQVQPLAREAIRVGQGLRTGCNAFFYVELVEGEMSGGLVPVVTGELFGRQRMWVPPAVLKPILRRQVELSGLRVTPTTLRGRLLDLRDFHLPENVQGEGERLNAYPVMPYELADYVRRAARTFVGRGETRTLIPSLSAVRTNGLGPDEVVAPWSLFGQRKVRMWYMIPDFAPRHAAPVCVARVIHNEPVAILNRLPPVLVDANFSTLWCEDDAWSPEIIFAILNSAWGQFCMEALGATLGGGALKLEATHLRQLPIPALAGAAKEKLKRLVCEALDAAQTLAEFRHYRPAIDHIIISALFRRRTAMSESRQVVEKLAGLIRMLRAKRSRGRAHQVRGDE